MLDLEPGLHTERGTFLDGERGFVQRLKSTRLGQFNDDVRPACDFETQRQDDDFTRVVGIRDRVAGPDAQ